MCAVSVPYFILYELAPFSTELSHGPDKSLYITKLLHATRFPSRRLGSLRLHAERGSQGLATEEKLPVLH